MISSPCFSALNFQVNLLHWNFSACLGSGIVYNHIHDKHHLCLLVVTAQFVYYSSLKAHCVMILNEHKRITFFYIRLAWCKNKTGITVSLTFFPCTPLPTKDCINFLHQFCMACINYFFATPSIIHNIVPRLPAVNWPNKCQTTSRYWIP